MLVKCTGRMDRQAGDRQVLKAAQMLPLENAHPDGECTRFDDSFEPIPA